jgi:predicted transcriptional regulator
MVVPITCIGEPGLLPFVALNRRTLTALLVAFGSFILLFAGTGAAAADGNGNGLDGSFQVARSRPGDSISYTLNLIKIDGPESDSGWAYDAGARLKVERADDRVILVDGQPQVTQAFASTWAISDVDWSDWADEWEMSYDAVEDCQDDVEDPPEMPSYSDYDDADEYSDDMDDWSDAYDDYWDAWGDCWDFLDVMYNTYASIVGEPWHVAHAAPDGRVLATTEPGSQAGLPGNLLARDLGLTAADTVLTEAGPSSAPCGFHSDLQDGPQSYDAIVHVRGSCPPAGGHFGAPPSNLTNDRFVAIGEDVVRGMPAIVYGYEAKARDLRLWFNADIPYPVRMVYPVLLAKDFPVLLLFEMTEFKAGSHQEGSAPLAPALAPRVPTGPDATDVATDFPLTAALAAAIADQQDTSVGTWVANHADAAVDEARFVSLRDDGSDNPVQQRWAFTLVSGGDAMHVTATKGAPYEGPQDDRADLGPLLERVPPGTVPAPIDDGVVVTGQSGSSGGRIGPDQMAAQLPRVADLLTVWNADGMAGGTPSWAFLLRPDGSSFIAAGFAEARTVRSQTDPTDEGETDLTYSFYGVGPDGSFRFAEESPARYNVPPAEQAGASEVDPEKDDDWNDPNSFGLASIGYWKLPKTKTTATVGAAAGLVGLLAYALMPAKSGALGLFSRIGNQQVLEHPLRQQITDLVAAEPGIHFQELVRRLDAGRGTMEHHLRKLVSANVLTMQVSQGFTCFFPKGKVDRHMMAAAPVLKSEGARQILQAIQANPGVPAQDVAATIGLTPSTVNYHLKRLVASGLVSHARQGRFILLTPTPLGTQALGAWGRT